jgi:arsenate reductase (thioredoxin)
MRSTFRVLFLGTRDSERSILAEYLLRSLGGDRFEVWSAGETPAGEIHPLA